MDTIDMRSPKDSTDGFVHTVNRPGIDDVLSNTQRLFPTAVSEESGGINAIDRNPLSPLAYSQNLYHQPEFHSVLAEDVAASTPYAAHLQPGTASGDPWPVNDDAINYQTWIDPHPSFDDGQASSPLVFSELGAAQTPIPGFQFTSFSEEGIQPSPPVISYNYNAFQSAGPLAENFGYSDNHVQLDNHNWVPGEQSSEATGLDSVSIYGASASRASHTDLSSPITNPDFPKRHPCNDCNQGFDLLKDLKRHNRSKKHLLRCTERPHAEYICLCGYRSPRKDLYTRHLDKCKLKNVISTHYACLCGQGHDNKGEHMEHISECGKQKAGRPRKGAGQ